MVEGRFGRGTFSHYQSIVIRRLSPTEDFPSTSFEQQYRHSNHSEYIIMARKEMTLVYYHVPEDKDDPDCPNVFGVPQGKATLRLAHIHEAFPLKGNYIFRFKYNSDGQAVWLDLPNPNSPLPTYRDRVQVKATRVGWEDGKVHGNYKEKPLLNEAETTERQPEAKPKVESRARVDLLDEHPKKETTKAGFSGHSDLI